MKHFQNSSHIRAGSSFFARMPFEYSELASNPHRMILAHSECISSRMQPAFPLRKFFKESLTHGPLNFCVNEKTVRVNDSPYFQFWLSVDLLLTCVAPPIPVKSVMPYRVIRRVALVAGTCATVTLHYKLCCCVV